MADSGGVGAVLDDGYPLVVGADDDVGSVVTYRYRIDVVDKNPSSAPVVLVPIYNL